MGDPDVPGPLKDNVLGPDPEAAAAPVGPGELERKVNRVIKAWLEGDDQDFHRRMQRDIAQFWPELYNALSALTHHGR